MVLIVQEKRRKMARRSRVASGQQEEWQQARSWLMNLGVFPQNIPAANFNASVFDLAQSLRDGVLLCQAGNHLLPNSVRDINMKPQMSQASHVQGFVYCERQLMQFFQSVYCGPLCFCTVCSSTFKYKHP